MRIGALGEEDRWEWDKEEVEVLDKRGQEREASSTSVCVHYKKWMEEIAFRRLAVM